jgi:THO complex subunit 2
VEQLLMILPHILVFMMQSHTSHILGFKFQYYQRPEVKETVPDGLYILATTLIKENFIDLESV